MKREDARDKCAGKFIESLAYRKTDEGKYRIYVNKVDYYVCVTDGNGHRVAQYIVIGKAISELGR